MVVGDKKLGSHSTAGRLIFRILRSHRLPENNQKTIVGQSTLRTKHQQSTAWIPGPFVLLIRANNGPLDLAGHCSASSSIDRTVLLAFVRGCRRNEFSLAFAQLGMTAVLDNTSRSLTFL